MRMASWRGFTVVLGERSPELALVDGLLAVALRRTRCGCCTRMTQPS